MNRFSTWRLSLRLWLATILLFGLLYVILTLIGYFIGFGGPTTFAFFALLIVGLQYLLGPKMVETMMRVRYISREEAPWLHEMVEELAIKAGIPTPKIGVAEVDVPNAFAFGRSKGDGRICVTRGIMNLLDREELKAVLGHEISHINHRDMAVMTLISVIPLICYYIFISTLFSGGDDEGGAALIGIGALIAYFIGNLLVLFVSRTREYYADQGSVELVGEPHKLASALYKLVYGTAVTPKENIKEVEGVKAFFVNDISDAGNELSDLKDMDLDLDGSISATELQELKYSTTKIGLGSKIMELMSTHPNMLKRIKKLAELS